MLFNEEYTYLPPNDVANLYVMEASALAGFNNMKYMIQTVLGSPVYFMVLNSVSVETSVTFKFDIPFGGGCVLFVEELGR